MAVNDDKLPGQLEHTCTGSTDVSGRNQATLIGWDSDGFGLYACRACRKCFLEDGNEFPAGAALLFAKAGVPDWFPELLSPG